MINYVPPPIACAVLVVHRDARTLSTPQADHLLQSNAERRRYPAPAAAAPPAPAPAPIRTAVTTWSRRHVD